MAASSYCWGTWNRASNRCLHAFPDTVIVTGTTQYQDTSTHEYKPQCMICMFSTRGTESVTDLPTCIATHCNEMPKHCNSGYHSVPTLCTGCGSRCLHACQAATHCNRGHSAWRPKYPCTQSTMHDMYVKDTWHRASNRCLHASPGSHTWQ